MNRKASLKDIAKAVGVSTALVSYVLNGKEREERVSFRTAKKIRKVAKEMNYQPNQIAKSLKSGKSLAIGLIVADISNPFFSYLARIIEDESKKKGYTVIFGSSDENYEKSQRLMDTLINRQIDGFIIAPAEGSEPQLEVLKKADIPFVLIDRYFENVQSSYVIVDNYLATYKATEELIKKGYSRIAYVRYANKMQHTEDRYRGYTQALKDYKIRRYQKLTCEVEYDNQDYFFKAFERLFAVGMRTEAILFSTNTLSIFGLKALNVLGKKVPSDIDVFCFDQSESYDLFYHPVDYIHQPLEQIGQEAVHILIDHIESGKDNLRQVKLEPSIVVH